MLVGVTHLTMSEYASIIAKFGELTLTGVDIEAAILTKFRQLDPQSYMERHVLYCKFHVSGISLPGFINYGERTIMVSDRKYNHFAAILSDYGTLVIISGKSRAYVK